MSVDCSHLCWNFVAVPNIVTSYFQLSQSQSWLQPPLLSSLSLSSNMVLPDITTNQRTGRLTEKLFHIRPLLVQEKTETGHKGTKTMKWVTSLIPPHSTWQISELTRSSMEKLKVKICEWVKSFVLWEWVLWVTSPTHPHLLLLLGDASLQKNRQA